MTIDYCRVQISLPGPKIRLPVLQFKPIATRLVRQVPPVNERDREDPVPAVLAVVCIHRKVNEVLHKFFEGFADTNATFVVNRSQKRIVEEKAGAEPESLEDVQVVLRIEVKAVLRPPDKTYVDRGSKNFALVATVFKIRFETV